MTAALRTTSRRSRLLPAAVADLRAAISRLIDPTTSYVNSTYIEIPGLYLQLVDNLAGMQGSGNRGIARSLPSFWVDAAEQKTNIDFMVTIWPTGTAAIGTVAQLRALATKTWTVDDVKTVRRLAGIINAWADDIAALLQPEHVKHITASCPACGADTIQKRDSAGDLVRSPALQVITEQGCTCQVCNHHWAPDKYIDLCRELGFPLPAGVLE